MESHTQILSDRMSNLITALQNRPDVGLIQAGSEYRIVNRSTGEVLETCHTEDYAKKMLEKYK